ncbi:MAG TPA: hypothetical protein VHO70_06670 [Chitinispirillaceae bacterium]|nr:hypothetical protein [Chitinispirillaceae bacterium]
MKKQLYAVLGSLTLFAIMTGCSTDRLEAVNIPEEAKPGQTVSVAMVNAYTYLSPNSNIVSAMFEAKRDSIHLMVRVPDEYEIVEVKSAVIKDLKGNQILGQLNNLSNLAPLLTQYVTQLKPMNRNSNLDTSFKGKVFSAHSSKDPAVSVSTSTDKGTWMGYSAPFDVTIKAGDTLDTMVSIDSILGLAGMMGIDTSGINIDSIIKAQGSSLEVKSIAFTTVPALIQVSLKTKSTVGKDSLFFYSITSSKFPTQEEITGSSSIDLGSMLFAELNVSESALPVINQIARKNQQCGLSVIKNGTHCLIHYNATGLEKVRSVSIYSSQGIIVSRLDLTQNGYARWNYTDKKGLPVASGRYFVSLGKSSVEKALPIDILR